jgi:hypothetical protein
MKHIETVYICDPAKNVGCSKTGCHINGGPCYSTSAADCAVVEGGEPVADIALMKEASDICDKRAQAGRI